MFARLEAGPGGEHDEAITLTVDGVPVAARHGDTVAAVLFASGRLAVRMSAVSGSPRAPYCMMGVCFECLVTIDGRAGVQACMTAAASGMDVRTAQGGGHGRALA